MDKHIFSISWYSINKPKYISFKYIFSWIIQIQFGWTIAGFVSKDKAILELY